MATVSVVRLQYVLHEGFAGISRLCANIVIGLAVVFGMVGVVTQVFASSYTFKICLGIISEPDLGNVAEAILLGLCLCCLGSYMIILIYLKIHMKIQENNLVPSIVVTATREAENIVKTVGILVTLFYVLFYVGVGIPYIAGVEADRSMYLNYHSLLYNIVLLNSVVNPFIYVCIPAYRKAYIDSLPGCCALRLQSNGDILA